MWPPFLDTLGQRLFLVAILFGVLAGVLAIFIDEEPLFRVVMTFLSSLLLLGSGGLLRFMLWFDKRTMERIKQNFRDIETLEREANEEFERHQRGDFH